MEGAKILCKRVVEPTVVNMSFIELYTKLHIVSFFSPRKFSTLIFY